MYLVTSTSGNDSFMLKLNMTEIRLINKGFIGLIGCILFTASVSTLAADTEKQADVARRGALVMPFSLEKTQHQFTKTKAGGIQRVVVRDSVDQAQIQLIKQHLQQLSESFAQGDFSGPEAIHGADMPGLPQLKAAKPGSLQITYADEIDGASLTYSSKNKQLVKAVHRWFDAQVHDHGHDAMAMPHCSHKK